MKIDILRSTNPALSYADDEDDPTNQSYYYDKPSPIDLSMIPTRLIDNATISGTPQEDSSQNRSKSAPPASGQGRDGQEGPLESEPAMMRRGSSFGVVLAGEYLDPLDHGGQRNGVYSPSADDSSSSGSSDTTEVARNPSLRAELISQILAETKTTRTATTAEQLFITEPVNVATESSIIHPEQPSLHTSTNSEGEGPIVVRPNPVKPTQQTLNSTVAASTSLGMPTATATSSSSSTQQLQQPHRPIALSPFVRDKVVPVQIVLPQSLRPQQPIQQQQPEDFLFKEQRQLPKAETEREAWCQQATALHKKEERAREIARQQELQRLHDSQCDFPNSSSFQNQQQPQTTAATTVTMASGRQSEGNPSSADHSRGGESRPQHVGSNNNHRSTTMSHHSHTSRRHTSSNSRADNNNQQNSKNNKNIESTTPIFDKLVTDEVRELQVYARMVENQNLEIERMRQYQNDLEKRLQDKSRDHELLETSFEERERNFKATLEDLHGEIKRLRNVVQGEENKNKLLLDQIRKKERDILGILEKKKVRTRKKCDSRGTRITRSVYQLIDTCFIYFRNSTSTTPRTLAQSATCKILDSLVPLPKVPKPLLIGAPMNIFGSLDRPKRCANATRVIYSWISLVCEFTPNESLQPKSPLLS